jgi:hypothetical protein
MNNLEPWQPFNQINSWNHPAQPMYTPPLFQYQPQLPFYQSIVTPPPQVIVVQERRRGSGLEGLALIALLFLGGRALRQWGKEREQLAASRPPSTNREEYYSPPRYQATSQPTDVRARPIFSTPNAVFGDGMMLVGEDIEPGTYRCAGRVGETLSWVRLRNASGESASIIASHRGIGSPQYVTVNEGEYFRSEHSGGWAPLRRS